MKLNSKEANKAPDVKEVHKHDFSLRKEHEVPSDFSPSSNKNLGRVGGGLEIFKFDNSKES